MSEENIVYVKIKNGIFKCYKSEQMHKPIYYPVESKTNGYIDYNDIEKILTIEDLYQENKELKKQLKENQKYKEVIDKVSSRIKLYGKYNGEKCTRGFSMMTADFNELLDILKKVE